MHSLKLFVKILIICEWIWPIFGIADIFIQSSTLSLSVLWEDSKACLTRLSFPVFFFSFPISILSPPFFPLPSRLTTLVLSGCQTSDRRPASRVRGREQRWRETAPSRAGRWAAAAAETPCGAPWRCTNADREPTWRRTE